MTANTFETEFFGTYIAETRRSIALDEGERGFASLYQDANVFQTDIYAALTGNEPATVFFPRATIRLVAMKTGGIAGEIGFDVSISPACTPRAEECELFSAGIARFGFNDRRRNLAVGSSLRCRPFGGSGRHCFPAFVLVKQGKVVPG